MANAMALNDLVQVRAWCSAPAGGGQASVNSVWYFVSAVGGSPATDQDVADNIEPNLAPIYKTMIYTGATFRGVQAGIHELLFPYKLKFLAAANVADAGLGSAGLVPMPPQTSGLIRWNTTKAGQKNRGRMYLPFPAQDDDSGGGSPSNTYNSALVAMIGVWAVPLTISVSGRSATLIPVLVHQKDKDGIADSPTVIASGTPGTGWATQRRRGDYGRLNLPPI